MRSLSIPRKPPTVLSKTLRNTFRSRYDGTWSLQTQISSLDPGGTLNRVILIHYHEINLKRNNRSWFENRLKLHMESLLDDLPHEGIRKFAGRMILRLNKESPADEFVRRIRTVFGIANFALASQLPADLEAIQAGLEGILSRRPFNSFKIDARRGTKEFPLNSQQLNETLGAFVRERYPVPVRMKNPDLTCFVELVGTQAFLYTEKTPGAGGLPMTTGGNVLCLLSGGIDSPVAAFRLMRRGCKVSFVHFHSFPHTTRESQQKVTSLLGTLSRHQLQSVLYLVPFAELQRQIVAYTPAPLRVLLYRRFMMRIAEAVATKAGALALVTGDCLGQVASQTLQNLGAVSNVVSLPIFRPLIGEDKEDIIKTARSIGTYEISILPDQDCCTLFVPKHPETMAQSGRLELAEKELEIDVLVESALAGTVREVVSSDFATGKGTLTSHAVDD